MSKVWIITGAGRGMGLDIAKAALASGHKVVATGRNTEKVAQAIGEAENLLVAKLEVTKPTDAERNEVLSVWWKEQNGKQAGDPAKLANALISIADQNEPPARWIAGADAVSEGERKMADFKAQIEAYRELSSSLAHEEA